MKKIIIGATAERVVNSLLNEKCKNKCNVIMDNIQTQEEFTDISQRVHPDIAIIDDELEGQQDDMTFLQQLRQACPSCRIVLITHCKDVDYAGRMAQIGIYDIFIKGQTVGAYIENLILEGNIDAEQEKYQLVNMRVRNKRKNDIGHSAHLPAFKSVIGITGTGKTGKTFLASVMAFQLSKQGHKVSLVDISSNRTLYGVYCWGKKGFRQENDAINCLHKGTNNPFAISSNTMLYTSSQNFAEQEDYATMLETLFSKSNMLIFDMDINAPIQLYKHMDRICVVQDMDYLNIIHNTAFIKKLKQQGVNPEKIAIILNKFMQCGIDANDLKKWLSIEQSYQHQGNEILFENVPLFKVNFNMQDHIASLQHVYNGNVGFQRYTHQLLEEIDNMISNLLNLSP